MGHQGDCFGFVFGAVFDGGQCCNNTLIVGDFVWSSLLLGDLSSQLSGIRGWLGRHIEVYSAQLLVLFDSRDWDLIRIRLPLI